MIPGSGIRETVLYYSPRKQPHEAKLKGLLVRMGVRIRTASPEQASECVAALMGFAPPETPAEDCGEIPMTQELLVMHNFTGRRMDEFFAGMRRAGIPRIGRKAVLTETSRGWTLRRLYREIDEEHRRMTEKKPGGEEHV